MDVEVSNCENVPSWQAARTAAIQAVSVAAESTPAAESADAPSGSCGQAQIDGSALSSHGREEAAAAGSGDG
jgi:hypothetical protein